MANTALGGFRWVKSRDGAKTAPVELRAVADNYGTGIFRGDPLKLVNDGTVAVAAAGDAVYAVCDGVEQFKESGVSGKKGNYLPSGTRFDGAAIVTNPQASVVRCIPVRGQTFEGDCNTAAASIAAAVTLMFNNCDVAAGAGGSTTTGRSTFVLDNSSTGTGTAQARLLEIVPSPDNDVTSANWKARFEFNEGTEPLYTATGT